MSNELQTNRSLKMERKFAAGERDGRVGEVRAYGTTSLKETQVRMRLGAFLEGVISCGKKLWENQDVTRTRVETKQGGWNSGGWSGRRKKASQGRARRQGGGDVEGGGDSR